MGRKRHLHLRQPGGTPNNGKNDKIGTDGRKGATEYRFSEPPSLWCYANLVGDQNPWGVWYSRELKNIIDS